MGTLASSVWGGGGGGGGGAVWAVIGFCCFGLCLFILVCQVLCLVYFFYGRSFLCLVVFSHWESLVLGFVDVESV